MMKKNPNHIEAKDAIREVTRRIRVIDWHFEELATKAVKDESGKAVNVLRELKGHLQDKSLSSSERLDKFNETLEKNKHELSESLLNAFATVRAGTSHTLFGRSTAKNDETGPKEPSQQPAKTPRK